VKAPSRVVGGGAFARGQHEAPGSSRSRRTRGAPGLLARVVGAALWLMACDPAEKGPSFPVNRCSSDKDCADGSRCFEELALCGLDDAVNPYEVVLRVTPREGEGTLASHTFAPMELAASRDDLTLDVPAPLVIDGLISAGDARIRAEVTFRPISERRGLPATAVSVTSQRNSAADPHNFTVSLPPDTRYSVQILPLGDDSLRYPPAYVDYQTSADATSFTFDYQNLITLEQTLVDTQGTPLHETWIRLRDLSSGRVVSSFARTEQGAFSLVMLGAEDEDAPSVLDLENTVLEVDLDPTLAWQEVIHVPASRIDRSGRAPVRVPVVPERVRFLGAVERVDPQAPELPNAGLMFVSNFPAPNLPGDLRNRDWCRGHESPDELPLFSCSTRRMVSADEAGRISIDLLPGNYDVFVVPLRERDSNARVTTRHFSVSVETQPGGAPQGTVSFELMPAAALSGAIMDAEGKPLPNVVVRSVALSLTGTLGEVAAYNQPSSVPTDAQGRYALALDAGYYDIVVEPPAASGYPLLYYINRPFDPGARENTDVYFTLQPPVIVSGTAQSEGRPLAGASIDAFAMVTDLRGRQRAVSIGRAVSDDEGRYVLTLPPEIR
jgi:hypothetical protein